MIINCKNCNKNFNLDPMLIPENGRQIQCGSCLYVWFYKKTTDKNKLILTNEADIVDKKIDQPINVKKSSSQNKVDSEDKIDVDQDVDKQIAKKNKSKNTSSKFFSYIIVFIISFVALVILIDSLKTPLIKIFPGLETILFSLFEILKDVKLFIIDLY